jgi:hypothetical protein
VEHPRPFVAGPDGRRASSRDAYRRAAKPRTEARLGVPMRSPRVRVGVGRAFVAITARWRQPRVECAPIVAPAPASTFVAKAHA